MSSVLRIVRGNELCDIDLRTISEKMKENRAVLLGSGEQCDCVIPFLKDRTLELTEHTEGWYLCEGGRRYLIQQDSRETIDAAERLWVTMFCLGKAGGSVRSYPLRGKTTVLGREEGCDILLTSRWVSRTHAVIEKRQNGFFIRDLNSKNGVSVNQHYVCEQQLQEGDLISILPYFFRLCGERLELEETLREPEKKQPLPVEEAEQKERPSGPEQRQNCRLKLVLVSKKELQTMWLPALAEGNFWFTADGNPHHTRHKLVSVSARDKKWYLNSEKAVLVGEQHQRIESACLTEKQFWVIEEEKQRYILIVEANNEKNNAYHKYRVANQTQLSIGRLSTNDICYDTPHVSKLHASLIRNGNVWQIRDQNSTNGVYVNRRLVRAEQLKAGDTVYIMGLCLIIGTDFIAINDRRENVSIRSDKLEKMTAPEYDAANPEERRELPEEDIFFNRLPRRREALNLPKIVFEAPPVSLSMTRVPMLLRYGGALLTGNVMSIITAALFPMMAQKYTERERKEYEKKRIERYTQYLQQKKREICLEQQREEYVLNRNNPPLNLQLERAGKQECLWERRKSDDDFLNLRIGWGNVPIMAEYDCPDKRLNLDDDPLEQQMYQLAQEKVYLKNVPIMASFAEEYVVGVLGERVKVLAFLQRLIMQLAIQYSFDEVKLVFLIEPDELEQLRFVRYLPHCWNDQRTYRFIATKAAEGYHLSEYLKGELERQEKKQDSLTKILKMRPYYFIFAFSKQIFDSVEVLKEIVQEEDNCGFTVLSIFDQLPKECSKIFQLSEKENRIQYLKQLERQDEFFQLDPIDERIAQRSIRSLFDLKLQVIAEQNSLPKMLSFLDMFGVGRVEDLNPLKRWSENDPVKSLTAPVGVGTDGSLFELDLHEKYHGPHGLVAGMTGSGKSEFIITYILSMAVNYHPDEVAFVLIDYKGGGLAGAFEDESRRIHLPHLVGTITNLDGAAIHRSLRSIQSELLRRQNLFNEAKRVTNEGTMDIYSYQKLYRKGVVSEPLPHLFVISDEFAELKAQQPDFMDQLISAARIGRSLGIHLILATQKPSGVVNEQIWSNTKFRVCLRVQERADSMDMLKRPEAAELEDTGRFYLQVGYNELFSLGQSAWCGAEYIPREHMSMRGEQSVSFVDTTGRTIVKTRIKRQENHSGMKQIVAIVQYLSDLARRNQIAPRKLWKDPLPKWITTDEIAASYSLHWGERVAVMMGLIDDPDNQSQYPLWIDLQQSQHLIIVGEAGSGKTTFLQTMLCSAAEHYSPEQVNFYIMDFSSHTLSAFSRMPHCGMVLQEEDEQAISRFFRMLKEIIAQRKRLFAEQEVSNYESYLRIAPLPLILVVIDNLSALSSIQRGDIYIELGSYLKESLGAGIRFVLTGSHLNDFPSKVRQNAGGRIALQMKDRFDYTEALNQKCAFVPSTGCGRGMCVYQERVLEYQAAICMDEQQEQKRIQRLRKLAGRIQEQYRDVPGAKRLEVISEDETYEAFCSDLPLGRLPIGYSVEQVRKIAVPFQQLYALSVYFGNPDGIAPVLDNFLTAAAREQMDVWIVRRKHGSLFSDSAAPKNGMYDLHLLDCTEENLNLLWKVLVEKITERKQLRDAYCREHQLSPQQENVMSRAAPYLRRHAEPILILFESFADFCKTADGDCLQIYPTLFTGGRGYHYYFISCFYPGDRAAVNTELLFQKYNPDQLLLLMGGQFDQQPLTNLPKEYAEIQNMSAYNRFLLQYQGKIHPMIMPCGTVQDVQRDPDELPLFS